MTTLRREVPQSNKLLGVAKLIRPQVFGVACGLSRDLPHSAVERTPTDGIIVGVVPDQGRTRHRSAPSARYPRVRSSGWRRMPPLTGFWFSRIRDSLRLQPFRRRKDLMPVAPSERDVLAVISGISSDRDAFAGTLVIRREVHPFIERRSQLSFARIRPVLAGRPRRGSSRSRHGNWPGPAHSRPQQPSHGRAGSWRSTPARRLLNG